jgi:RNA ligase
MFLDMDRVRKLIAEGYISVKRHPEYPLFLYGYTRKCQYDWRWTPETIACRGLILDDQDNVVARPFPKFFTPDQYKDLRNKVHHLFGLRYSEMYKGRFEVSDKLDGSLGIMYKWDGQLHMATRGSFVSDQALHATELLRQKYKDSDFADGYTYLFEIIYPENRIVVDYGGLDDILLLTVIDNEQGRDSDDKVYAWATYGKPYALRRSFHSFDDVLRVKDSTNEGFVVRFDSGLRVKVKFEEYLRLHHLLTNVSARDIWWRLREGEPLDDLLTMVPDEFDSWVHKVEAELRSQYNEIESHVRAILKKEFVMRFMPITRKKLAIKYAEYKYKGIMFQMLDNKQYQQSIWRLIRPEAEKPFSTETNDETPGGHEPTS